MKFLKFIAAVCLAVSISGCGPRIAHRQPLEKWEQKTTPQVVAKPIFPAKKKIVVVIDAGHGGKDPGTQSEKNHYIEKQLTLATAEKIQKYLEEKGYQTYLTRDKDAFVELKERAEIANRLKADLFVSIHYNFSQSFEAEGVEVFYFKDEANPIAKRLCISKKIGEEILFRISKHTGAHSRGVKTANLAVLRETKMPAVLIEGGFLSNPKEREKLKDPEYRSYLAYSIARGIDHYFITKAKE